MRKGAAGALENVRETRALTDADARLIEASARIFLALEFAAAR